MDSSKSCVYLYRDASSSVIRYVGRGLTVERATQHAAGSHNPGLSKLIASGRYLLEVAGPYDDPAHAALVEAALISALQLPTVQSHLTNRVGGHGPKFAPLGVPARFAGRPLEEPISLAELGRRTGGAIVVRNACGEDLGEGRPRLDPLDPQDDIIVDNIVQEWHLERVADDWAADPSCRPRIVVGAAGPLSRRYVPGALQIDRDRLGGDPIRVVPVVETPDLDACELRGRVLSDAKFDRSRIYHFIWVDGDGEVRYCSPRRQA